MRIESHAPEVDLMRVCLYMDPNPALAPSTKEPMTKALRESRPCHGDWEGKGGGALHPRAMKIVGSLRREAPGKPTPRTPWETHTMNALGNFMS